MSENRSETSTSITDEKGFFRKLSNGDFGLAKTYWLYGVLVAFVLGFGMKAVSSIGLLIILMLIHSAYHILILIGTWRAATKYQGWKIWAVLGKIAVVLGIIMLAANLIMVVGLLG